MLFRNEDFIALVVLDSNINIHVIASTSVSCCDEIIVTSNGPAKNKHSRRMGLYTNYKRDVNGMVIYKHVQTSHYLFMDTNGQWRVREDNHKMN